MKNNAKNVDEEVEMICLNRIEIRKNIKHELQHCIDKLQKEREFWQDKTILYLLTSVIEGESTLEIMMMQNGPSHIYRCEKENLDLYYRTLYTPEAPRFVVDMLLDHKSSIENLLIRHN